MTKPNHIQPRTLKGFRDFLPDAMIPRERLMDTARRIYRSYGFAPIDTPALEYLEILTGKGSEETDKQLYRFEDHGGRKVGLRFDLTVPLARFVAQHAGELVMPFKRYHIGPVWRGENTQRGRYREFLQCDFDTIGSYATTVDIETILVVHDLLDAIGFDQFTIHVSDRRLLNGLLQKLDLSDVATTVLRVLDKANNQGPDAVAAQLKQSGAISDSQLEPVLKLTQLGGTQDQVLAELEKPAAGNELAEKGVSCLAELVAGLKAAGVADGRIQLDPSIARGLDYYTGTIFESVLDQLPSIGSVSSGGRYDNLAALYTQQQLPGIGGSLGLDRLLAAMEELGMVDKVQTPAAVLVTYFDASRLHDYLRLAAQIRAGGIGVELYPEPKRLGQQLKYADRRGFRVAVIAGEDELASGQCQLKDLRTGKSTTVPLADEARQVIARLQEILD